MSKKDTKSNFGNYLSCDKCGKKIKDLPWNCKRCGKTFCDEHRLPEDHDCEGLKDFQSKNQERWINAIKEETILDTKINSINNSDNEIFYPPKITRSYPKRNINIKKKKNKFNKWLILLGIFTFITLFFVINFFLFSKGITCEDGTKHNHCSNEKPLFCSNGTLIENSDKCGCPYDYRHNGSSCAKIQRCDEGTEYNTCASIKPVYCYEGNLINKSSICGCNHEYMVYGDQCVSIYQTEPKNITLSYTLNGKKGSFKMEVYGGLNNYLQDISRSISYYTGESEPTVKDFLLKNIDDSNQQEFLKRLTEKIKNISKNEDERVRVAVSIVQNIPYDNSGNLDGRYAYEVLYDNTGVCGEKSPLLAWILRDLGYGVAIIDYGDVTPYEFTTFSTFSHEAVGIQCPLQYSYNNTGFCFIESTRPSIITDSEGDYPSSHCIKLIGSNTNSCTQKLPAEFTMTIISQGKSFTNVSDDFKDAQELAKLNNISKKHNGYLSSSNYNTWKKLVKKYGLTFDN